MKTHQELKEYLARTGMYSWNGVLDDFVFGAGKEWYVYLELGRKCFQRCHTGETEQFVGPFESYSKANEFERKHFWY